MTLLSFTKMHGLGNDFLVLDATREPIDLTTAQLTQLADRHFGVGFDQLLVVERATLPDTDFHYRIFNADGSEVEQCGNGARCFARFVREKGLSSRNPLRVTTCAGRIELYTEDNGLVRVNMGVPKTQPEAIPFIASEDSHWHPIDVAGESLSVAVVNMGNPHAVLNVPDVACAPVARLGPLLETHVRFPARVNVGFMQVLSREAIALRVFERGTGETLACGTGACAAVVAGHRAGLLADQVTVRLAGGELHIQWSGEGQPVLMSGPAVTVFEGQCQLAAAPF